MLLLLIALSLCLTRGLLQPEIVSPGPTSGIVLREQPGLLITNCRIHIQKVDYDFTLSPELEMRIAEGGPQLIDITPIDQSLQALDQMPALANLPVVRSWTAADTALCLTTTLGYALTLGLSFILYKKVNGMQESVSRCMAAFPWAFKRCHGEPDAPTEPEPTLIEIDTLPVHHRMEDK
ncbi:hypothetical protein Q8A67_025755 [Cirrhinus molitorella]|uniref:Uncharacterized protein n=1 Tax=Cirrhinus molitorella TaxID=172907 RepID=A0AA88P080_9TELE|nr:hypothetical protein Q8A67_025755 [Cirrhinus molitorella]